MKKRNVVLAVITVLTIGVFALAGCAVKESSLDADKGTTAESADTGETTDRQEETTTVKETESETEEAEFLNDNSAYFVIIDGVKFMAGDAIKDFSKVGLKLMDDVASEDLGGNTYMIGAISMINDNEQKVFNIVPYNVESDTLKLSETVIGGVEINPRYSNSDDEEYLNIEVYGGIKLGATIDDVKAVFGEPSYVHESNSSLDESIKYTTYKYKSDETYRYFEFDFENGVCDKIVWKNLVFNE